MTLNERQLIFYQSRLDALVGIYSARNIVLGNETYRDEWAFPMRERRRVIRRNSLPKLCRYMLIYISRLTTRENACLKETVTLFAAISEKFTLYSSQRGAGYNMRGT